MDEPIVRATWQAGALSAVSNVLGQAITCYQAKKPFTLNYTDLAQFVLFAILSTPPNYWWQAFLESKFPGYISKEQPKTNGKISDDSKKSPEPEKQLSIRNTAIKFALDQTIGATVNTILFIAGIALLRGQSLDVCVQNCKEQFWPLVNAGLKLWPMVSLTSFTMVPLEYRTTFGSIVGLFWGCYLSMLSSSDKTA